MTSLALGLRRGGRLARLPGTVYVAGAVVLFFVLVAIFAPLLAPHDPNKSNILETFLPPSAEHPLGTEAYGRDLLSRLIYGSRTALVGPFVVVFVSTLVGTTLGIASAWHRGWVDAIIGRFFDLSFAFPAMLLALMFVAVLSPGLWSAALALSIAYIPWVGRLVRSTALREVNEPYVEALRTQGVGPWRISARHVLPNVSAVIIAQSTAAFGYAMVDLAGISYLGLGVQEPTADWGKMIEAGQSSIIRGHPQQSLYAGAVLVIAVVAFIALGDALSDPKGRRR